MALHGSHQCMSDFMIGYHLSLLFGKNGILLLITGYDCFNTFFQISLCNDCTVVTNCPQCCFIYNIGKLCTGCTGCHTCNRMEIHIIRYLNLSCMHFKDSFTPL